MSSAPTSATAVSAAQTILATVSAAAQAGLTSSITTALQDLTGVGLGLVGQEAEDFDTFVDNLTMEIEGGASWSTAWSTAYASLVTSEKSQLMADALKLLQDASSIIDNFTKSLTSLL